MSFRKCLCWLLVCTAMLVMMVGCTSGLEAEESSDDGMAETDHDDDMDEMDPDHDTAVRQFVPNDGAEVRITSPANGQSFRPDDTIPVTIETVDFTIGEEGNHWHIYVDGAPIMVMGGNTFVLQNLMPGDHKIEVFLSLGTHEDLEQGDKVMIMVTE